MLDDNGVTFHTRENIIYSGMFGDMLAHSAQESAVKLEGLAQNWPGPLLMCNDIAPGGV